MVRFKKIWIYLPLGIWLIGTPVIAYDFGLPDWMGKSIDIDHPIITPLSIEIIPFTPLITPLNCQPFVGSYNICSKENSDMIPDKKRSIKLNIDSCQLAIGSVDICGKENNGDLDK